LDVVYIKKKNGDVIMEGPIELVFFLVF